MAKQTNLSTPPAANNAPLSDLLGKAVQFYLDQWEEGTQLMEPALEDMQKLWTGALRGSLDLQARLWDRLPVSESLRQQARTFIEDSNEAVMEAQRAYVRASGTAAKQVTKSLRARLDSDPKSES